MLVSVGRAPQVESLGLEELGVELDPRKGIAADEHRRTTVDHIYAVGDCAGYWQLAHTAFREGEVAAENAMGHEAVVDNRAVPRPIYTDPEIAGVGLTEQEAREQYGDDVEVGTFPWVANARAVMQNETTGWVKSIHESRYGELLGLVMVWAARHRPDRGRRGRDRRRGHRRDGRGRHGRPPDPLGGDQGSGSGALGGRSTDPTGKRQAAPAMSAPDEAELGRPAADLNDRERQRHVDDRVADRGGPLSQPEQAELPLLERPEPVHGPTITTRPPAAPFRFRRSGNATQGTRARGIHQTGTMSDAALVTRPKSDRAFERLYTRHVHDVYRYVLAALRNPADAEDATQATFLNAYRAFRRGDRPELP